MTTKLINQLIKQKIVTLHQEFELFIKEVNQDDKSAILMLIEIKEELWVCVLEENFFSNLLKFDASIENTFTPFFLIPVNLKIVFKNNINEKISFLKLSSIELETKEIKNNFVLQNTIKLKNISQTFNLLEIDNKRKLKIMLLNEEKKLLIKKMKEIKKLDIFNIFEIKTLMGFIEEKLKTYITNKNSWFLFAKLTDDNYVFDLNYANLRRTFLSTKPYWLEIKENNKIVLNIIEK